MTYKIDTEPHHDYNYADIEKLELKYNAKYIGQFPLKNKNGNYVNFPAYVFYQENPPQPDYSNYFALYYCPLRCSMFITGAQEISEREYTGVICEDGETVLYSRFRHDYRTADEGKTMIDGGSDYIRANLNNKTVKLGIVKDELKVID